MPTTTDDPELVVVLGDRVVRPVTRRAGRYVFVLPASDGPACLVSRNVVPNEARPWQEDRRRLGVMVQRLSLTRGDRVEVISPDHPALTHGWWAAEGDGYTHWRWTDGAAALPVALGEASILEVKVAGGITYAEGIDLAA